MPHNTHLNWPSVSQIVKDLIPNPGIDAWKARVGQADADRTSQEARDYGTHIHAVIEQAIKTNKWTRKFNLKYAKAIVKTYPNGDSEKHVTNGLLKFHGTIDYLSSDCIADWKTGRSFDVLSFFQMLGYSYLGGKDRAVLIPVGEKAKYLKPCWFMGLSRKWPIWESMVHTWWKFNPSGCES